MRNKYGIFADGRGRFSWTAVTLLVGLAAFMLVVWGAVHADKESPLADSGYVGILLLNVGGLIVLGMGKRGWDHHLERKNPMAPPPSSPLNEGGV